VEVFSDSCKNLGEELKALSDGDGGGVREGRKQDQIHHSWGVGRRKGRMNRERERRRGRGGGQRGGKGRERREEGEFKLHVTKKTLSSILNPDTNL